MLWQHCPQISIVGLASSAAKGRKLIKSYRIHFIFLDIAMPNEDGFAFIDSIESDKYGIIFITAYQEYALSAFKASAIDYLLKPISHIELINAVGKAIRYYEARHLNPGVQFVFEESLSNVRKQMYSRSGFIESITVRDSSGFRVVKLSELIYLRADSNYTVLYLAGNEEVVATNTLGQFEVIINNPFFFRIHRSTIINLEYLKAYYNYQGNFAEISNGTRLSISRRRLSGFLGAVSKFTGKTN